MKKKNTLHWIFAMLLLCLLPVLGQSQSLQFSRVVNLKGFAQGLVTIGTVPQGKVWKIENMATDDVLIYLGIPGAASNVVLSLHLDIQPAAPPGLTSAGKMQQPYWLNEGEEIIASGTNSFDVYHISIIEFTVVP